MSSTAIAALTFACTFGGALLGVFLRGCLPANHLDQPYRGSLPVSSAPLRNTLRQMNE